MSSIAKLVFGAGMLYFASNYIRSWNLAGVGKAKQDYEDAFTATATSLRSSNETVAQAWETYQSKLAGLPTLWDVGRPGACSVVAIFSGWKIGATLAKLAGTYGGATPQQRYWIGKIGAIFTGAITWYITRSAGLTFVNTVVCLYTDHNARDNGVVAGSAIVGAGVSVVYSFYTALISDSPRSLHNQYLEVVHPIVLADETVKMAAETYRAALNRISFWPTTNN